MNENDEEIKKKNEIIAEKNQLSDEKSDAEDQPEVSNKEETLEAAVCENRMLKQALIKVHNNNIHN